MPSLAGSTEADAVALLTANEFKPGTRTEAFDEVQSIGVILKWSSQGLTVEKGSPIDFVVSKGPQPRTLPAKEAVVGQSFDVVAKAMIDLQLVPAREDRFDEKIALGLVITIVPDAGTGVARGTSVTIAVSKGPELVPVPNVVGKTVDEAVAAVRGVGLKEGKATGAAGGKVIASNPPVGTPVRKASKVDFTTG